MNATRIVVCALVACIVCSSENRCAAQAPVIPPNVAPIKPGDIILREFFSGWLKYDPVSNELFQLGWSRQLPYEDFKFDFDGAIVAHARTGPGTFVRIDPTTGAASYFGDLTFDFRDFAVEANGDLLLAKPAASASIQNGVRSVTDNGNLYRYSRATGLLTTAAGAEFFSPRAVAVEGDGDILIGEFFDGFQFVNPETGQRELAGNYANRNVNQIEFFPDGDVAVLTDFDGLRRIDLATNGNTVVVQQPFIFWQDYAVDWHDNVWVVNSPELKRIDSASGVETNVFPQFGLSRFTIQSIAIVPVGWTAPAVPEPSSILVASIACGIVSCVQCATQRNPGRSRSIARSS